MDDSSLFRADWAAVAPEIVKSASSLFLNGICIVLAILALYFSCHRGSPARHVLVCTIAVACTFAIAHMLHQVVFTVFLLRFLYSAGVAGETVGAGQHIQNSIGHLHGYPGSHRHLTGRIFVGFLPK
ncbi:hypothetical protein C8R44DRAFT_771645 [Mycena epipterygia]|nr:hypothetical protein C8R44DRAFT_771645 [Mycena epipterygia]